MTSRVPQRADAQRNRERLLAAAETAFNAQGAGAALDDIAKAAGVGNATLYRHFPTRAKLIEAVYDQRIAELCAAAAELAQSAAPARALHEWLSAVVAHVTDRRVLADAFLAAYEGPADIEPPQVAAWHNAIFDAGRPLLAAAQDAGTARQDLDIAELLALVTGVARAGSAAQAERFLSVLLEGITPRLRYFATVDRSWGRPPVLRGCSATGGEQADGTADARDRSGELDWIIGTSGNGRDRRRPAGNLGCLLCEMHAHRELRKCDVNNIARLTSEYSGKSRGGASCNHGPRDYDRALYKTKPLTQPPGGRRIGASGGERI